MTEIKCPNDLNQFILGEPAFDQFPKEECKKRKFYGDCYHCFSTAIANRDYRLRTGRTMEKLGRTVIDADKFLGYLIFSKHIDGLTCGEVKEAIEMCKVDVLDKIRAEIEQEYNRLSDTRADETLELGECLGLKMSLKIIDKYKAESED